MSQIERELAVRIVSVWSSIPFSFSLHICLSWCNCYELRSVWYSFFSIQDFFFLTFSRTMYFNMLILIFFSKLYQKVDDKTCPFCFFFCCWKKMDTNSLKMTLEINSDILINFWKLRALQTVCYILSSIGDLTYVLSNVHAKYIDGRLLYPSISSFYHRQIHSSVILFRWIRKRKIRIYHSLPRN